MDLKVLEVQKWLNLTYGNHPDFPAVTEDGLTGNSTIKALIRGLQIEAGVKVDGVLGSGSLAAIGTISPSLDADPARASWKGSKRPCSNTGGRAGQS